jgi:DNA-binding transcriptional regulator YiaG
MDYSRDDPLSPESWDAARIRRLRERLGDTQHAFAARLGTRQQTVSEWERGTSHPRRMAQRLLHLLAEEHGVYEVGAAGESADGDG